MLTRPIAIVVCCCLFVATSVRAADEAPKVHAAQGEVESVDKDTLVVKPHGADGKFTKAISLKLTGTSSFSQLSTQNRSGKTILVQKQAMAKDLAPKQQVTVIYANSNADLVLLVAVMQAE